MAEARAIEIQDQDSLRRGSAQAKAKLIAVGGGKGGVGKSFLSSHLALFMANMGHSVVIVDLDLGSSNVHTNLGEPPPQTGLTDFFRDPSKTLISVSQPTKFRNLRMISGSNDSFDIADLSIEHKSRLMHEIHRIEADFVILDLAAGTHSSTLDFFLMGDRQLVALTPDPTSIENAYRFMKAAFFRRIKRHEKQLNLGQEIEAIMNQRSSLGVQTPAEMLSRLKASNPEGGERLAQLMNEMEFLVVLNQVRGSQDTELGKAIPSVCMKYFAVPSRLLGTMDYDNAVWQSLRRRKPLLLEHPQSRLYAQLLAMARDLANDQKRRAVL